MGLGSRLRGILFYNITAEYEEPDCKVHPIFGGKSKKFIVLLYVVCVHCSFFWGWDRWRYGGVGISAKFVFLLVVEYHCCWSIISSADVKSLQ